MISTKYKQVKIRSSVGNVECDGKEQKLKLISSQVHPTYSLMLSFVNLM